MRHRIVCHGMAFTLGLIACTSLGAKPPDLPGNHQIECSDSGEQPPGRTFQIELEVTGRGIQLKLGGGLNMPGEAPAIDTITPSIISAYLDQILRQFGQRASEPEASAPAKLTVQQLFEIAEIYRRTGHYQSAHHYYQRAHRADATSQFGRRAIDRIGEMEDRLREAEESESQDPEAVYQRILRNTIPLGLVENSF